MIVGDPWKASSAVLLGGVWLRPDTRYKLGYGLSSKSNQANKWEINVGLGQSGQLGSGSRGMLRTGQKVVSYRADRMEPSGMTGAGLTESDHPSPTSADPV